MSDRPSPPKLLALQAVMNLAWFVHRRRRHEPNRMQWANDDPEWWWADLSQMEPLPENQEDEPYPWSVLVASALESFTLT